MNSWGKSNPGKENSMCKGPEAGTSLGHSGKRLVGLKQDKCGARLKRQITQGLVTVRSFNFILVYQEATKYLPRGVM